MRAKIGRLIGLLGSLGLGLIISAPLWAGSVTYDYDDFGRLIDVLYDDGTHIIYTYDDAGNRLTQVITVPALEADLSLSIIDSADPVIQGDNVTYTATVTNNGPDAATGVDLAATLPADTTLVLATPSQGTCDAVVSCALGTIASLGSATVTIEVSADAAGSIGYLMSVSATEADPNGTNNSQTETTTVNAPPSADLTVLIADSADPVIQGDNVTYTATVTNNGPDAATGVDLAATLPADTTLVLATPSQGTCDAVVSCALGTIASLGSATVTIEVSADAAGSIGYLMSVSATEADPNATNNSQTETTTVNAPPSGDVIVDNLDPNTSLTGTWKVSTDANSFAGQSLFADKAATFRWLPTLPQQGTYAVYAWWVFHNKNASSVPYEISHAGGTDIVNVNQHDSALAGQWNLLGNFSFNAGSGAWVEISRPSGRVYADAVRFVLAGGSPSADLSVAMTDTPDPVDVGNNITYTATVTNNGPNEATNVTLTDSLPASLSLVSAVPSQGNCSGDPNISCALDTLAASANATVTIVATANSEGSVDNTASVSATQADPQASNDSATASTTVNAPGPSADLSIAVVDSPDPVTEGDNATYSVTVTNNGPDTATGVNLAATLPGNVTLVSATPSQGSCDVAVSCSLGSIASLGNATVSVVVSADAAGTITYPMSVSATEADPQGSNDSATATTTVDPLPGGDIIVDNLDAGGTQIGSWNVSTDAASFAGQSLWSKKAGASFEWHFTIPTTGSYQVFAWWVDRAQISTSAPYTIHHAGGPTTITVDQSDAALEGQWNLLGSFTFNAGSSHFVEIDTTNGLVSADAVKLVAQ